MNFDYDPVGHEGLSFFAEAILPDPGSSVDQIRIFSQAPERKRQTSARARSDT